MRKRNFWFEIGVYYMDWCSGSQHIVQYKVTASQGLRHSAAIHL